MDMLIIRGVNVFPSQVEEILRGSPALSLHFMIEVTRSGRMDEAVVKVEPRLSANSGEIVSQTRSLAARIKELVGVTVGVEAIESGSLPRSTGKAARIRDLR